MGSRSGWRNSSRSSWIWVPKRVVALLQLLCSLSMRIAQELNWLFNSSLSFCFFFFLFSHIPSGCFLNLGLWISRIFHPSEFVSLWLDFARLWFLFSHLALSRVSNLTLGFYQFSFFSSLFLGFVYVRVFFSLHGIVSAGVNWFMRLGFRILDR